MFGSKIQENGLFHADIKISSEYNQEIPQSQTADKPMGPLNFEPNFQVKLCICRTTTEVTARERVTLYY